MSRNTTVIVGPFSPPTGGAARNTSVVCDALLSMKVDVRKVSVSGSGLAHQRDIHYHLERMRLNLSALMEIIRNRGRSNTIYVIPSGGLGLIYTAAHILAARLLYGRLVIHHHTFRYIDGPSAIMRLIVAVSRGSARHVFLSPRMAQRFEAAYGRVLWQIASNAFFVAADLDASLVPRDRLTPVRVGHLSNLCRDKGFFEVADAFEELRRRGVDAELCLAGPVIEPGVERRLENLMQTYPGRVQAAGPVFGADKSAFYASLDVFLFPTQFSQEAQPNVVFEALAAGVPVLATPRGSIPEMVCGDSAVSSGEEAFAAFVADRVQKMSFEPAAARERRQAIRRHLAGEVARARLQFRALFVALGGTADAAASLDDDPQAVRASARKAGPSTPAD